MDKKKEEVKPPMLGEEAVPSFGDKVVEVNLDLSNIPCKIDGLKLNLGCGGDVKNGYLNVDKYDSRADANWDISKKLPLHDNSVTQVVSFSVLEHFSQTKALEILKEWSRVIKKGGNLVLIVPDMVSACERYLRDPEDEWSLARIYGHQGAKGQFHKAGFTPKKLFSLFGRAGFIEIQIAYFNEPNGVREIYVNGYK